jgi:hypothetical protein
MSGIRLADITDIKALCDLGAELLESSAYAGIKPDEKKFRMLMAGLMGSKLGRVMVVVDNDDIPQGFMLGVIDEYFFSRYRYASDMATYIRRPYRRYAAALYKNFIKWAKTKPRVVDISFAQSSGMGDHERWCKLMTKLGLKQVGSMYTMRVEPCQG